MEAVYKFLWLVLLVAAGYSQQSNEEPKSLQDILGLMLRDAETIKHIFQTQGTARVCRNVYMQNVRDFSTEVSIPQRTKVIRICGDWVVQGQVITFTMNFENDVGVLQAQHKGQAIDFNQLVTELSDHAHNLAFPHNTPPKYTSMELSGSIKFINTDRSQTSVVIRGANQDSKGFIIFYEDDDEDDDDRANSQVEHYMAVAAEYYRGPLSTILQRLTGFDISQLPCFGDATFSTFAYSSNFDNTSQINANFFTDTSLLRTWDGNIESGLVMRVMLTQWTDTTFTIEKEDNGLILKPTIPEFQLHRLLDCMPALTPSSQNKLVSFERLSAAEAKVKSIKLLPERNMLTIQVQSTNRRLCFYYGLLCFSEFEAEIDIVADNTYTVRITNGIIPIENTLFRGNGLTDTIMANGNSIITRTDLENHFHAKQGVLPVGFYRWITQDLQGPRLSYRPSRWLDSVDFWARTTIFQNQLVDMETIVHRQDERFYIIYGFHLDDMNLIHFLNAISDYRFDTISLLQQNVNIHTTLSAIAIDDTPRYAQVRRGLFISARITIPSRCEGDRFCSLLGKLYPQTTIHLEATIRDLQAYSLIALLHDVEIEQLKFSNINLKIEANTPPMPHSLLSAKVRDAIYSITFDGKLSEDGTLTLTNPDQEANIRPGLKAEKFRGKITVQPDGSIGQREYDAAITISCSKNEVCLSLCQTTIISNGRVGVVTRNKFNTYWFIKLPEKIQLGCLLRSLDINHETHWPIRTSDLLHEAEVSFTDIKSVETLGSKKTIPRGRHFAGLLYIVCITANIVAQSPDDLRKMDITITFPPIIIENGIIKMGKDSNFDEGPTLHTVVGDAEVMKIKGYLKVMKMEFDGAMVLNDEGFTIDIPNGYLESTDKTRYNANLCIVAPQGCITGPYLVSGHFKDSLNKIIWEIVDDHTSKFAKEKALDLPEVDFEPILEESKRITDKNNDAAAAVRRARELYNTARKEANENGNPDHRVIQTNLQDTITQLNSAMDAYNTICNHANKANTLSSAILQNLMGHQTNMNEKMKRKELADILKNSDPKLEIRMENVKLVDMNSGRFDAIASLRMRKGEMPKEFSMRVNLDDLKSMARRVLENIGSGFDSLI